MDFSATIDLRVELSMWHSCVLLTDESGSRM